MEETLDFIAHVDADGKTQSVEDHAEGVARLCSEFCAQIDPDWSEVGTLLGLLHDQGKYQRAFQKYIRHSSGLADHGPARAPHSMAGAIHAYSIFKERDKALALSLSHCIGGHHRGLYDSVELRNALKMADNKAYCRNMLQDAPEAAVDLEKRIAQLATLPDIMEIDEEDRPLFVRMLFSCLVDADFLDTEQFMNPTRDALRSGECISLEEMKNRLETYVSRFNADSQVNLSRAPFLNQCRTHGQEASKGLYSLCLPTGGGKTIASMMWALEHAIHMKRDRIIYVIPYTSIITQTAQVFKEIFGANNVLEHHSDIELKEQADEVQERDKLLTENWDVPLVVTTNVQFFESLFSHRVGRCRKLHNICNSVVVFDEVQMFPPSLLNPMLQMLQSLHYAFRMEPLFCTATLPLFDRDLRNKKRRSQYFFSFNDKIQEVVPYDEETFASFDKVSYHWEPLKLSTLELSERLCQHESVLCIVYSRKDAAELFTALSTCHKGNKEELIHLSRRMCSLHIQNKINEIKQRLKEGKPVKVISTQLVEAGVDLDFPVVYRAMAGLDSVLQAAGRCNREGRMQEPGEVYLFSLTDGSKVKGEVAWAQSALEDTLLELDKQSSPRRADIERYYEYFYNRVGSFDGQNIAPLLWGDEGDDTRCAELRFDYEEASRRFKYIEDQQLPIIVPYGEKGKALIDKLCSHAVLTRSDYRLLHRLSVGVNEKEIVSLGCSYTLGDKPIAYITETQKLYDDDLGLKIGNMEPLMV